MTVSIPKLPIDVDVVKKKSTRAAEYDLDQALEDRPAGQTALPDVVPAGEGQGGRRRELLPCEGLEEGRVRSRSWDTARCR